MKNLFKALANFQEAKEYRDNFINNLNKQIK